MPPLSVPPHSTEAERSVIGSVLLNPDLLEKVIGYLIPEDFYHVQYQKLYQLCLELYAEDLKPDILIVCNELRTKGLLHRFGGAEAIELLIDQTPSISNISLYAGIVKQHALSRKILAAAVALEALAADLSLTNAQRIDRAEEYISTLRTEGASAELRQIKEPSLALYEKIATLSVQKNDICGLSTGFEEIDHITNGFQPSALCILGARPSMGKTAFALALALNAALAKEPTTVAIFSLEMSEEDLILRMACSLAKVNSQSAKSGSLKILELEQLKARLNELSESPIFINDKGGLTLLEIRSNLRRLARKEKIGLVVIDYLQLITVPKSESRTQEVSLISRKLKELAKEFACPVLALSQLSRNVELRPNKRPTLSDLRESGAIEQDADLVMLLYRDEYYFKEKSLDKGLAELIIAKHRNGPTGSCKLKFASEIGAFRSIEKAREAAVKELVPTGPRSAPKEKYY